MYRFSILSGDKELTKWHKVALYYFFKYYEVANFLEGAFNDIKNSYRKPIKRQMTLTQPREGRRYSLSFLLPTPIIKT